MRENIYFWLQERGPKEREKLIASFFVVQEGIMEVKVLLLWYGPGGKEKDYLFDFLLSFSPPPPPPLLLLPLLLLLLLLLLPPFEDSRTRSDSSMIPLHSPTACSKSFSSNPDAFSSASTSKSLPRIPRLSLPQRSLSAIQGWPFPLFPVQMRLSLVSAESLKRRVLPLAITLLCAQNVRCALVLSVLDPPYLFDQRVADRLFQLHSLPVEREDAVNHLEDVHVVCGVVAARICAA